MKDPELKKMILESIKKLGCASKKEITSDVVDTAIYLGIADRNFMIALRNIGYRVTSLKNEGLIAPNKSNKCNCGYCEAGILKTARNTIWTLA